MSIRHSRNQAFLDHFKPEQIENLLWNLERIDVDTGETLIDEGELDQTLYIVTRGVFDVVVGERVVATLMAGSILGEVTFLDASPRTARVRAGERSQVLALSREKFQAVRKRDPELACAIALELGRILAQRFRTTQS